MSTANPEQSASVYKKPLRHVHPSKKVESTTSSIADSFPALPASRSSEKVNALRNELQDAQSEIELMQAKLRNLQALKQRHQARHEKNLGQIEFMNQVKERNRRAFELKQRVSAPLCSSSSKGKRRPSGCAVRQSACGRCTSGRRAPPRTTSSR